MNNDQQKKEIKESIKKEEPKKIGGIAERLKNMNINNEQQKKDNNDHQKKKSLKKLGQ